MLRGHARGEERPPDLWFPPSRSKNLLLSWLVLAKKSLMTHHPQKRPDSQETGTKAEQQGDRADRDQAHRGKWPWPEPWQKTVLKVLLAAATFFVHPIIDEGAIKVTVLFRMPSAAIQLETQPTQKERAPCVTYEMGQTRVRPDVQLPSSGLRPPKGTPTHDAALSSADTCQPSCGFLPHSDPQITPLL